MGNLIDNILMLFGIFIYIRCPGDKVIKFEGAPRYSRFLKQGFRFVGVGGG